MRSALTGSGETEISVRELLQRAQKSRAPVQMELRSADPDQPVVLTTTIEQVLKDSIVISQPLRSGLVHPLGRYERCRLIVPGRGRPWAGWTKMLGRRRISSGGPGALYGYRLAMPEELEETERRRQPRAARTPLALPEAELMTADRAGPIYGQVRDISPMGASLICRNAPPSLRSGKQIHLKLDLPEPAGLIREKVNVVEVYRDPEARSQIIRLRFRAKIDAIADVLRAGAPDDPGRRRSA